MTTDQRYDGRELQRTIMVGGLLTSDSLATWQKPFFLAEADYLKLQSTNKMTFFAVNIFFAGLGYCFSLAAKIVSRSPQAPTSEEWWVCGVAIAASLIIYVVGKCLPHPGSRIKKEIENHFSAQKKQVAFLKGAE